VRAAGEVRALGRVFEVATPLLSDCMGCGISGIGPSKVLDGLMADPLGTDIDPRFVPSAGPCRAGAVLPATDLDCSRGGT